MKPVARSEASRSRTVLLWLRFFAVFVVTGFAVSAVFHALQVTVFHKAHPYSTYLFDPSWRFTDWTDSVTASAARNPYLGAKSAYFPFAYVLMWMFSGSSILGELAGFALVSMVLVALAVGAFWRLHIAPSFEDRRTHLALALMLAVAVVFSYPLHFAFDRGNIDLWVGPLCLLYVTLLRSRYAWIGSIALGIAIALKGYPAAFCLLALPERKYFHTLLPLALGIGLTVFGFCFFKGGYTSNLSEFRQGVGKFRDKYVVFGQSIGYSADPYNAIRTIMLREQYPSANSMRDELLHPDQLSSEFQNPYALREEILRPNKLWNQLRNPQGLQERGAQICSQWSALLKKYDALTKLFAIATFYFTLFVPAPLWRRIAGVCLLAILFPDIANDYKLMALLPALLFLIAKGKADNRTWLAAVCLAGLMIPKNYRFDGFRISDSCLISPLLLLGLAGAVFIDIKAWSCAIRQTPARCAWYLYSILPAAAISQLRRAEIIDRGFVASQHLEGL